MLYCTVLSTWLYCTGLIDPLTCLAHCTVLAPLIHLSYSTCLTPLLLSQADWQEKARVDPRLLRRLRGQTWGRASQALSFSLVLFFPRKAETPGSPGTALGVFAHAAGKVLVPVPLNLS